MTLGRALAGLLCLSGAALGVSCASVLGVSSAPPNVAENMCKCAGELAFFDSVTACEELVGERLAAASDEAVAAWLETYEDECTKCATVIKCFRLAPICRTRGCTKDWQCCSAGHGGTCDVETGVCSD